MYATGDYAPLDTGNDSVFAFARWTHDQQVIVASNFSDAVAHSMRIEVPGNVVADWQLADGRYRLIDEMSERDDLRLVVDAGAAYVLASVEPLDSVVLSVGHADIVRHTSFGARQLPSRHVDIWLPADYATADKEYKVLYVHDGQNLFIAERSYYNGTDWGIDDTLQRLIDEGKAEDTIVVGIWNTSDRVAEYLPWEAWHFAPDYRDAISRYMGSQPMSREYIDFIVDELKPFVDANYRSQAVGRSGNHRFVRVDHVVDLQITLNKLELQILT